MGVSENLALDFFDPGVHLADFLPVYDPNRGELALQRLDATLNAVDLSKRPRYRRNLDTGRVAIVVLAAAAHAAKPHVRCVFERMPREVFDVCVIDTLTDLGWAAWHVNSKYQILRSGRAKRVVPIELAQRVTDRKSRMLRLARYHLHDHPTEGPVLAAMSKRSGYVHDASALTTLSVIYRTHQQILEHDKKLYREADLFAAEQDSAELLRCVGAGAEDIAKDSAELLTRIFIVTKQSYEKLRAAALFLFGKNSEEMRSFPELHTAIRRKHVRPTTGENGDDAGGSVSDQLPLC